MKLRFLLALVCAFAGARGQAPPPPAPVADAIPAFKATLQSTLTRHLNLLLNADGSVRPLKGKTAEAQEALAFRLLFEVTGEAKFRAAALSLAERALEEMRATKFGVLAIKEKEKPGGESIAGGGPPALGQYVSRVAYILHQEGGRDADLKYLATVIDDFPWNEKGWWSADIDVKTGESKLPLSKPSPVNKTAAVAMAGGILSEYVRAAEPELAARLKAKTDQCVYGQILPAQLADGFWNYGLSGRDPKNKDILGYFMLTTELLMELQKFAPSYREPRLEAAVQKARGFALKCIAPMTAPNGGSACSEHSTRATPSQYGGGEEAKRSFQLGFILLGGGEREEGMKIMQAALRHFPFGNAGQDGAHAAAPSALILSALR